MMSELSIAHLARFLVVEPAHQDLSPRLGTGACLVGGVLVDSEALVATSSILRIFRLRQF